jgi:hypothetical protein
MLLEECLLSYPGGKGSRQSGPFREARSAARGDLALQEFKQW